MPNSSSIPVIGCVHLQYPCTALTVVAAPILKLWVLYSESFKPAVLSVIETRVLNWAVVSGVLFYEMNKLRIPGDFLRIAK